MMAVPLYIFTSVSLEGSAMGHLTVGIAIQSGVVAFFSSFPATSVVITFKFMKSFRLMTPLHAIEKSFEEILYKKW